MSLLSNKITAAINGINFNPELYEDNKYKVWVSALSPATCKPCFDLHGKLYLPNEADINYMGGIRNCSRIIYSNDGLVFVTYNHYFTFNQIC